MRFRSRVKRQPDVFAAGFAAENGAHTFLFRLLGGVRFGDKASPYQDKGAKEAAN
jgi:hypothetical protein